MALALTATEPPLRPEEGPLILTEDQVEQLLQEAEARLRKTANEATRTASTSENQDVIAIGAIAKRKPLPKLTHGLKKASYIKEKDGVAQVDEKRLLSDTQRKLSTVLRNVDVDQLAKGKQNKREKPTSGADWFDLPKTVITPQLKRDLQIIEMRSVLDPHRHYKKTSGKNKVPAFSQAGTVIAGPTEWYSSRINKKDRAKNFVEEAIAVERATGRFKRKYDEIQEKKISGKRSFYKDLMDKRKKRR